MINLFVIYSSEVNFNHGYGCICSMDIVAFHVLVSVVPFAFVMNLTNLLYNCRSFIAVILQRVSYESCYICFLSWYSFQPRHFAARYYET